MRRQTRGLTAIGISVAAASVLAVPLFANAGGGSRDTGHPKHPHTASTVKLDILAINDFHGQLEKLDPARTSSGRINQTPAGGAEYLATHLDALRAAAPAAEIHVARAGTRPYRKDNERRLVSL